jgi:vacuolar-type H+-ATPase subunit E/Vma4
MATTIGSSLESYLHQQAREHALNRIAEAKEEAERIVAQTKQEATALKQASEERTARVIEEHRRHALAQARLKARQTSIRHHEDFLDLMWSEAATVLQAPIGPAKRLSLLKRMIANAAEKLGGGALEIQVSAEDHQLLAPDVLAEMRAALKDSYGVISLEVLDAPEAIWGGAIVLRRDAHQLVDNSINERLALAQRTLRDQVYRLLTDGPGVGSERAASSEVGS